MMDKAELARRAKELMTDTSAMHVLATMRADALERLLRADPASMNEIIRLQAFVAVIDDFRNGLSALTMGASERKGPVAP